MGEEDLSILGVGSLKTLKIAALIFLATSCFAGVTIISPANNSGQPSSVHVTAYATPNSGRTISYMIIYLDNKNVYLKYAKSIDTYLSMASGTHTIQVKSWDNASTIYQNSVVVNVGSGSTPTPSPTPSTGGSNIDQQSGWDSCDKCAGAGGDGP